MISSPLKTVPALSNAIRILRFINKQATPQGVADVAHALGINPSTCFNILKTLAHERLLIFDPVSKKYALGLGLVELARGAINAGYIPYVHPHLERIATAFDVTALLWHNAGRNRFVLVDKAESSTAIRVQMDVGQRLPALIGAFGRCVAAQRQLDKTTLRAMFAELRWQNPPTFEQYWRDVQAARVNGYSVDVGHYNRGITTVAAIIADHSELPVMAISTIALTSQLPEAKLAALADQVRASASEISSAMQGGRLVMPAR